MPCRAAYDRWSVRANADLTVHLDAALAALAVGFDPETIRDPGEQRKSMGVK